MTIRNTIAAAAALTLAGGAHAAELAPVAARSVDLGAVSGVAYYTAEDDGFHVVATLIEDPAGTPVRFETTLASGQSVVLSTPRAAGVAPVMVEISRDGDRLFVADAPATD